MKIYPARKLTNDNSIVEFVNNNYRIEIDPLKWFLGLHECSFLDIGSGLLTVTVDIGDP